MRCWLIILIVCLSGKIFPQDPYYTVVDKAKGLPSNMVFDIFQDKDGFMWFATNDGLCKYDGFSFKEFHFPAGRSKAGTHISQDKYGRIWYQNFDGYIFYVINDSLHQLKQSEPNGYIHYGIYNNRLYVFQSKGLDIFDLKTLEIRNHFFVDVERVSTLQENTDGIYIVYEKKLIKWVDEKIVDSLNLELTTKGIGGTKLMNLNGELVVYTTNRTPNFFYKIKSYNDCKKTIDDYIHNASSTIDDIWLCSTAGAASYNLKSEAITRRLFSGHSINYVYRDRESNYWFATANEGLFFVPDINTKTVLRDINPNKILKQGNEFYVGTKNESIYKLNANDLSVSKIFHGETNKEISFLSYDSVFDKLIFCAKEFSILDNKNKLDYSRIMAVKECKRINKKYFAVAITGGCGLFKTDDERPDEWDELFSGNRKEEPTYERFATVVRGGRTKTVAYNPNNKTVYYGSGNGLIYVNTKAQGKIMWNGSDINAVKLFSYRNYVIGLTTNGQIFKVTSDNKIETFNVSGLGENEGIRNIKLVDSTLFLFCSFNLYSYPLYKPGNSVVKQKRITEDITDVELLNNETMFLVSKSGVSLEKLKTQKGDNDAKSKLIVNYIKVNGETIDKENLSTFHYDQNDIELGYSVLSFKTDFQFPVSYKINSGKWVGTSLDSRSLKFVSLAPGDYTIFLRLGNPWEKGFELQQIKFSISKPFWLRWWFFALLLIVVVLIVSLIYAWRVKELRLKNTLLQQKIENEQKYYQSTLKAIRSQMNPHFFYNALNTIQSFIFSDDKRNASTYLAKFSKLTRLILEMSEKEQITLTEEINALQLYLDIEKVRFNEEFTFDIKLENIKNTEDVKFPPMLLQPYVENAIKHGLLHKKGNKELFISFSKKNSLLQVQINDNGIGRKTAGELNAKKGQKHQSFSTEANKTRLDILNKTSKRAGVEIVDKVSESGQALGTLVKITIPLDY